MDNTLSASLYAADPHIAARLIFYSIAIETLKSAGYDVPAPGSLPFDPDLDINHFRIHYSASESSGELIPHLLDIEFNRDGSSIVLIIYRERSGDNTETHRAYAPVKSRAMMDSFLAKPTNIHAPYSWTILREGLTDLLYKAHRNYTNKTGQTAVAASVANPA